MRTRERAYLPRKAWLLPWSRPGATYSLPMPPTISPRVLWEKYRPSDRSATSGLSQGLRGSVEQNLVAVGLVGQRDAQQLRDLGRPGARGVDDRVRADGGGGHVEGLAGRTALAHAHAGDARAMRLEPHDVVPRDHLHAELRRGLRVPPHERPREDDAVVGVVAGRLDAADVELGHDALRLGRREHARGQAAVVLQLHARLELGADGRRAGDEEVAALAEPDVDLHAAREVAAHADAVLHQAHVGLARPLRANPAAVATAGAAAEVAAVDDRDVAHAQLGQVVRDRQAHDAGPDDDDGGVVAHGGVLPRRAGGSDGASQRLDQGRVHPPVGRDHAARVLEGRAAVVEGLRRRRRCTRRPRLSTRASVAHASQRQPALPGCK